MIRSHPLRSLLTAILLLAGIGGTASASPLQDEGWSWWPEDTNKFSYTYAQARYDYLDLDTLGEADSFSGRVLVNLYKPVYVRGEYGIADNRDLDVETSGYLLSLGMHGRLDDHIDFFVEGGFTSEEAESGPVTVEADGPIVSVGLRGLSPEEKVEGELRYTYFWLEADNGPNDDFGRFYFDVIWRATDHIGLVVGGAWEIRSGAEIPYQAYGAGLRLTL